MQFFKPVSKQKINIEDVLCERIEKTVLEMETLIDQLKTRIEKIKESNKARI